MLVLTRKPGQKLFIGQDIVLTINHVRGNQVEIGIDAPLTIPIVREELLAGRDLRAELPPRSPLDKGPPSELPPSREPWNADDR